MANEPLWEQLQLPIADHDCACAVCVAWREKLEQFYKEEEEQGDDDDDDDDAYN